MPSDGKLPSAVEIHAIHEEIEKVYDLEFTGPRAYFPDRKIRGVLKDAREPDGIFERAAVLLKRLAHVHVFEDGNKRLRGCRPSNTWTGTTSSQRREAKRQNA